MVNAGTYRPHALMSMQCFIHEKSQFCEKKNVFPIEKWPSLSLARGTIMLPHLIIQVSPKLSVRVVTYERFCFYLCYFHRYGMHLGYLLYYAYRFPPEFS